MREQKLYDKYLSGQHWGEHGTNHAEFFAEFLKKQNFEGLLVDIGCGKGRDVNLFNESNFNVLGIDFSKDEIALAKKTYPNSNFEVQNAEKLNFENNSISAFFMINVIHYLDKTKAINEIFRTLKSKGYFFIHFNLSIMDKEGNEDYHHSEEEVLKLVSKFKILHKKILKRVDHKLIEHTHKIIELILQKP